MYLQPQQELTCHAFIKRIHTCINIIYTACWLKNSFPWPRFFTQMQDAPRHFPMGRSHGRLPAVLPQQLLFLPFLCVSSVKVTGGSRSSEVYYSGSCFHCVVLLQAVFSQFAVLKRLHCCYCSKRQLSPCYLSWAGWDMCDTLQASEFASLCNEILCCSATRDQRAAYTAAWHSPLRSLSRAAVENLHPCGVKCSGGFICPVGNGPSAQPICKSGHCAEYPQAMNFSLC